ncbi:hypothetical protein [Flavobacterium anhuiense]|jgi:hypothetical protein|uniref:hypothetical protein n=1 Tax=Flavobacterium anhuiense TaxID=459526 RepID=UPI000E6BA063|nr:hypothetical protein [Flavobacterium anhuiense]
MKDKLKVFSVIGLMILGIYCIATKLREKELQNIDFINKNYKITKGVVIKKSIQKGNHIRVRYYVGDKEYIGIDGFTSSQKVNEGDTILVKYSFSKPELMISQFNEQFDR